MSAALSLVDECSVFADIGCDHGKLCKAVLDEKKAKKVIAADISPESLNKAKKLLEDYENVEFRCCDGTDEGRIKADIMAVCGLGGYTIKEILRYLPQCTLITAPQDHVYELRKFFTENGYEITQDFIVKEGRRFYDFLKARPGEQTLDEMQLEYGVFCYKRDDMLREKLEMLSKKLSSYPQTSDNRKKINMITELLNWQR